ncbi:GntR family transcriptional regulator [Propioniciclava coleopterorum]|uniref:GntR family transcriptional regulator n=1 Tax=Propioniciclava coleopterorum TaxID=2714937 RepID=A0A6G7Y863_9ACTN|nr:FCD domain-containing protein [Propioniciclava coleopterorum]QIK72821.1 GntR family transcriptional regulator [Propioniciclava coleopterorum]
MHVSAAFVEALPRPAAEKVARLRMLIAEGSLATDAPLPIARVAESLDTDADTALEILMELGRDGYLERVDEATVRVCTEQEFRGSDVLEVRGMLEPAAVRCAAVHVRPADLITLRQQEQRVAETVSDRDFTAFRRAEDALVSSLLSLHPNAEIARLVADLRVRTPYDGLRDALECGVLAPTLQPHTRLLDLVEARDADAVEALIRRTLVALRFAGAPVMDAPYLHGVPVGPDGQPDGEFLDAAYD